MQPGDYQAKAHSIQWMTSEYQGERKTHLEVAFRTQDKREITWRGSFGTPKGIDFVKKQLKECGWTDPDVTKIKSAADLPNVVTIRIKLDEYKGKPQTRISIVTPFDASPATAADMRSLAAKLKGEAEAPPSVFADEPDGDLPF